MLSEIGEAVFLTKEEAEQALAEMKINLDFATMLWLATLGNAIDNAFYIFIYKSMHRRCAMKENEIAE